MGAEAMIFVICMSLPGILSLGLWVYIGLKALGQYREMARSAGHCPPPGMPPGPRWPHEGGKPK
ncbi:MAG: hypothetical protein LBW85_14535 [Deltaproteobacteria bacterium]|jgi:hypothetical protein|nr:hypothetical protein [Deltaproteobacteria bacterium]